VLWEILPREVHPASTEAGRAAGPKGPKAVDRS
jgi:hypothetical protein